MEYNIVKNKLVEPKISEIRRAAVAKRWANKTEEDRKAEGKRLAQIRTERAAYRKMLRSQETREI